jgi:MauM/NapG family ferredoxin protein
VVFFILFVVTFFLIARPSGYTFPAHWFLTLNPLALVIASLASRTIVVSLLAGGLLFLVLTLFFGRVFCGMVCPLGATIDFFDRFLFGKVRKRSYRPALWFQKTKYLLLFAILVAALFRSLLPWFMDPILILTRFFAVVVDPLIGEVAGETLASFPGIFRLTGLETLLYQAPKPRLFYGTVSISAFFLLIVGLGILDRRFWCQYLCPTGAFLGLLSRFPVFQRVVRREQCNSCRLCVTGCPTHAIGKDIETTSTAECILCGSCTARARKCNRFAFGRPGSFSLAGPDLQRRHAIGGVLAGLLVVPSLRANAFLRRDDTGRYIRPPGSIPESQFLSRCITCGACMKACPTNSIQPSGFSDGLHRLYTPRIVPRIGGCEEKCYLCGHVCPTKAIRKLSYEEKRFVKIGTAVIDRHKCLAWEQNRECLVCDECCPYNAITPMIVETTTGPFKVPIVDEDLCLGCGMCEQHCPIQDNAAITVHRFGEKRLASGVYVSAEEKRDIEARRRRSDKAMLSSHPDDRGASTGEGSGPAGYGGGQEGARRLPPGFIGDDGEPAGEALPPGFVP